MPQIRLLSQYLLPLGRGFWLSHCSGPYQLRLTLLLNTYKHNIIPFLHHSLFLYHAKNRKHKCFISCLYSCLKNAASKYQPLSLTHSRGSLCYSLLLQVEYFYGSWGKAGESELNSRLEILPNPYCQSVCYRGFSLWRSSVSNSLVGRDPICPVLGVIKMPA